MPEKEEIRIDKWLWAVRIYKTRTQATEACRKGRIVINGFAVKPSHVVKIGEIILVRKPPVIHTYKVLDLLGNRVSAMLAKNYVEDHTSDEELNKRQLAHISKNFFREPGTGRPTKKDRRQIDKLLENE